MKYDSILGDIHVYTSTPQINTPIPIIVANWGGAFLYSILISFSLYMCVLCNEHSNGAAHIPSTLITRLGIGMHYHYHPI